MPLPSYAPPAGRRSSAGRISQRARQPHPSPHLLTGRRRLATVPCVRGRGECPFSLGAAPPTGPPGPAPRRSRDAGEIRVGLSPLAPPPSHGVVAAASLCGRWHCAVDVDVGHYAGPTNASALYRCRGHGPLSATESGGVAHTGCCTSPSPEAWLCVGRCW